MQESDWLLGQITYRFMGRLGKAAKRRNFLPNQIRLNSFRVPRQLNLTALDIVFSIPLLTLPIGSLTCPSKSPLGLRLERRPVRPPHEITLARRRSSCEAASATAPIQPVRPLSLSFAPGFCRGFARLCRLRDDLILIGIGQVAKLLYRYCPVHQIASHSSR